MELDGRPVDRAELATLALYSYGHFTSMRVDAGRVRGLSLHIDRLVRDCKVVYDADLDADRVRQLVRRLTQQAQSPVIVRVTVFAPDLELGHPGADAEPRILVTTRPAPALGLPPLRLQTVRYDRDMPSVKHVGLFGTVYHRRAAQRAGFDDALFVGADGRVVEGATWNIGFLDGNGVVWPEADCLPGVTMRLVQGALPELGLESITVPVAQADLAAMRAAFISNAGVGVRAVSTIDDVAFAEDDLTIHALQDAYIAIPGEPV
jgi:branched-subunit amino acid aminotransferase/4-amino-4-deoxychorismate lyase